MVVDKVDKAVGMQNPESQSELVKAVELAKVTQAQDIGERAGEFPQRVPRYQQPLDH